MFQPVENQCLPDEAMVLAVGCDAAGCQLLKAALRPLRIGIECYRSIEEFLEAWMSGQRGCVFVNLDHVEIGPREIVRRLAEQSVYLPVVLLAPHGGTGRDVAEATRAVRAGAFDFLPRPWLPKLLLEAAREALQWEAEHHAAMVDRARFHQRLARLDAKERQVLDLIAQGMSTKAIASLLGLAVRTVETRRSSLMKKLRSKDPADLLRGAIAAGMGGGSPG
jgi:two-component system, LuxR family, response regulator FixJ